MDTFIYIVEYLLVMAILGMIPAIIASSKGYNFFKWWLFGVLIWIIALVCACVLKPYDEAQAAAQKQNALPTTSKDVPEELKKYKALLEQGVITEEEFEAKKAQLLKLI